MSVIPERLRFGWIPDYPDMRDLQPEKKEISPMLKTLKISEASKAHIPTSVDLRAWCPPIENQGSLGSCTANASNNFEAVRIFKSTWCFNRFNPNTNGLCTHLNNLLIMMMV